VVDVVEVHEVAVAQEEQVVGRAVNLLMDQVLTVLTRINNISVEEANGLNLHQSLH